MRTRELTTVEKFYLDAHKDKDVKELAKELGTAVKTINNYLGKDTVVVAPVVEDKKEEEVKPKQNPLKGKGFINKDGSVIMTESASRQADEFLKELSSNASKVLNATLDDQYNPFPLPTE